MIPRKKGNQSYIKHETCILKSDLTHRTRSSHGSLKTFCLVLALNEIKFTVLKCGCLGKSHLENVYESVKTNAHYRELFSWLELREIQMFSFYILGSPPRSKKQHRSVLTHIASRGSTSLKTAGIIQHSSTEGWGSSQLDTIICSYDSQLNLLQ